MRSSVVASQADLHARYGGVVPEIASRRHLELVSPVVAYLAHESCEATGRVFSVGGGRVAEVFIAEAPGYTNTSSLTPEDLRDNWATVTDQTGYTVPATIADETGLFLAALK